MWILTLIGVAIVFWLLTQIREIVVLLVVAYSIAYLIDPWVSFFERRGRSRARAITYFYICCAVIVLLASLTAVPTLLEEFQALYQSVPDQIRRAQENAGPQLRRFIERIPKGVRTKVLGEGTEIVAMQTMLMDKIPTLIQSTIPRILEVVYSALLSGYSLSLTIANIVLLPFLVFYISVDFRHLHRDLRRMLPTKYRSQASQLAEEINIYVAAFARGQITVGALLTILYMIGFGAILGLKLWFLLSLVAGFGNIVPYFGTLIALIFGSLLALLTYGDLAHVLYTLALIGLVQFLEGFVITPKVVGQSVGLSPLAVILALFIAGQLFGLLGLFLAIPATAVFRVLGGRIHHWVISRA